MSVDPESPSTLKIGLKINKGNGGEQNKLRDMFYFIYLTGIDEFGFMAFMGPRGSDRVVKHKKKKKIDIKNQKKKNNISREQL